MEAADERTEPLSSSGRKRRRPVNACVTCRARKVKCDERPNGCSNCERLQLKCVQDQDGISVADVVTAASAPVTGVKRKRTFRSCVNCRDSKVKCSGERPACTRCQQRATACVYDGSNTEPAWVQSLAPPPTTQELAGQGVVGPSRAPPVPSGAVSAIPTSGASANCPPSLAWLVAPVLPPKPQLHSLLEAYFTNVHPLRIFAFVHKPSFMRLLDEGKMTSSADQALLYIMCALGARFYALDYSTNNSPLPRELVQTAGAQWAKTAEEMFFADYSTISVTKLKALLLLHDHEARTGNYAGSFLLTGLIVRMAHALQLNIEPSTDIMCKMEDSSSNEASLRETKRRLMWACFMVDVWAGSGVDQLTILSERDIKIQLPCNERQFSLQIPCVTECLRRNTILDFIPADDIPEKPSENMGISAYYVRIIDIWQRVLRFAKHLDDVQQPWRPNSEFNNLKKDIQEWKQNLPSWLDFSSDNIYIRRESSQLGALFLIHCMYHHVLCDIHRIALPELFKPHQPFEFPPEQFYFMANLQTECFENAQRISVLVATTLNHGTKHLADPIIPSFVYNSTRIMLYHVARILDLSKKDAETVVHRTIELVQQNNQALREMSLMYPLAENLYITSERWLEKVKTSLAKGQKPAYIGPPDPSTATVNQTPENSRGDLGAMGGTPGSQINNLSIARLTNRTLPDRTASDVMNSSNRLGADMSSAQNEYQYLQQSSDLVSVSTPLQPGQMAPPLYPSAEPNMFDLNDLQNFFEAGSGDIPLATGFESFGQLSWMNNISNI